jgi:hypothetical protein
MVNLNFDKFLDDLQVVGENATDTIAIYHFLVSAYKASRQAGTDINAEHPLTSPHGSSNRSANCRCSRAGPAQTSHIASPGTGRGQWKFGHD